MNYDTCCQHEVAPLDSHSGRKETTWASCSLTSACKLGAHTCPLSKKKKHNKKPYANNQSISIEFCNVGLLLLFRVLHSLNHLVIDSRQSREIFMGSFLLAVEYIKTEGTDSGLYLLVLLLTKVLHSIVTSVGG